MFSHASQQQGYSLVEVLVSISILLIAIVGPMTIASKGIQNAQFARQQTTAIFFAQEGVEQIIRLREEEALQALVVNPGSGDTWDWVDELFLSACKGSHGCGVDQTNAGDLLFRDCSDDGDDACRLYRDESNSLNVYSHSSSGDATEFTRKIFIEEANNGTRVKVRSEVTWDAQAFSTERTVEVAIYLYDIYDF